ncbi:MAG TPA: L,D-transpeptidase [Longimicrobiales bacterium]|nr:L,D-transpeptidase [Longimicrobiales bacterium]
MNRRWILVAGLVVLAAVTGLFAFTGTEADPPAPSATLRLEVDVSERTLTVLEHGRATRTYGVTVGTARHPTPKGAYTIDWIVWNPSWHPPDSEWARGEKPMGPGPNNPMGRVKMFFRQPAYYVHGTSRDDQIGEAASHGCVRMRNEDVIELAQLVMEHGGEVKPPGWFQRVINRFRDTREVTLGAPVPVVIEG